MYIHLFMCNFKIVIASRCQVLVKSLLQLSISIHVVSFCSMLNHWNSLDGIPKARVDVVPQGCYSHLEIAIWMTRRFEAEHKAIAVRFAFVNQMRAHSLANVYLT